MKLILLLPFTLLFTIAMQAQSFIDASSVISSNLPAGFSQYGNAVSFVDFNGDGLDDLTFGSAQGFQPRFYVNTGSGFMLFFPTLPLLSCDSKHILWVDYDNDGDKDLYVACYLEPNRLLNNNGSFVFTDVTASAGLISENDPTSAAAFGDYNKDGFLDLYYVNLVQGGQVTTYCNHLYQNQGNGTFTDVTWVTNTPDSLKAPFCTAFLDYDNDDWPDLYNSHDRYSFDNTMYRNEGDGTFSDASVSTNTNIAIGAMNVGVADYDNDGDLDIYITNNGQAPYNVLYNNNGNSTFTNVAATAGVLLEECSWAGNFADFDNDTHQDLYVCSQLPGIYNGLYMNNGGGGFNQLTIPNDNILNYSNAIGDYNNDGLTDIIIPGYGNQQNRLWQNTSASGNNWIKIRLEGIISNRDGIGSWIEVYINGNRYVRYTHCGLGFRNQNSLTETIGLGQSVLVDSIKIRWLSGMVDKFIDVAANQTLDVQEGSTTAVLPVELADFAATSSSQFINLNWTTLSEQNLSGFELLRSDNATLFEPIAWVEAKGGENQERQYVYSDDNVLPGKTYYYKLKMTDSDGLFSFSLIVSADLENSSGSGFNVFPNPISGYESEFTIRLSKAVNGVITIHDSKGTIVYKNDAFIYEKGEHAIRLTEPLKPGTYFIFLANEGEILGFSKLVSIK